MGKINWVAAGMAIVAVFLMYMIWVVFDRVLPASPQGFGPVAALVLVGFAAFLGIMNILSFSAHALQISDAKQAFGLPEGSVRAILTISFIVLVGVLASYLVTSSDNHSAYSSKPIVLLSDVSFADASAREKSASLADGLVSVVHAQAKAAPAAAAQPAMRALTDAVPATDPPMLYDVYFYSKIDHRLGDDVSKQILTMLSTILAAMIGFYFGAKPGESDPDATRRAQASANMEAQIASAPDAEALAARVDALLADTTLQALTEAQRKELGDLKVKVAGLAENVKTTSNIRMSLTTTPSQMTAAAAAQTEAVNQLKQVEKRVGEIGQGK